MTWTRTAVCMLLFLPMALAVGPRLAAAADATLYEVTEDVLFYDVYGNLVTGPNQMPVRRVAKSAIEGTAAAGSAICPMLTPCYIVASGKNSLDLNTGQGPFNGTFTVVVNEPGSVDAPEVVIGGGVFEGEMDLAPALWFRATNGAAGEPTGSIKNGWWCTAGGYCGSLNVTFRLPVSSKGVLKNLDKKFARVPGGGHLPAFYVVDGKRVPVRNNERALGFPTVRVEVDFQ